jgi:hypothetical protein
MRGTEEHIRSSATVNTARWQDMALDNPQRFATEMAVLGLPDEDIQSALELVTSVKAELRHAVRGIDDYEPQRDREPPSPEQAAEERRVYNSARTSAVDRITHWMQQQSVRIDERTIVYHRFPLFLISAPAIPGCSTSFTVEQTQLQDIRWSVTILGTGLGTDGTISASASATFRTGPGETKVIFLPVTLAVEHVTVLRRGKPVSQGHRIDVASLKQQETNPGLMLLSSDAIPPFGRRDLIYELADDRTGAIASYEYTYGRVKKLPLRVGIKAYGTDLGVYFQAAMDHKVKLACDLRGGYDYELYRTAEGDGILWASPSAAL